MPNIYRRLLLILATATRKELARHIRYLQGENRILRDKLRARIDLTRLGPNRLIRFGAKLGNAFNEWVTIVHPNTVCSHLTGIYNCPVHKDAMSAMLLPASRDFSSGCNKPSLGRMTE